MTATLGPRGGAELAAPEQPATFLYGLHARAEEAWAVGYPGVALRYDASSEDGWTPMETDSKLWFEAVWSDEEGAIVAGRSGTLLQWSEVP